MTKYFEICLVLRRYMYMHAHVRAFDEMDLLSSGKKNVRDKFANISYPHGWFLEM